MHLQFERIHQRDKVLSCLQDNLRCVALQKPWERRELKKNSPLDSTTSPQTETPTQDDCTQHLHSVGNPQETATTWCKLKCFTTSLLSLSLYPCLRHIGNEMSSGLSGTSIVCNQFEHLRLVCLCTDHIPAVGLLERFCSLQDGKQIGHVAAQVNEVRLKQQQKGEEKCSLVIVPLHVIRPKHHTLVHCPTPASVRAPRTQTKQEKL